MLLAPRVLVSLKTLLPQLEPSLGPSEKQSLSRVNYAMLHTLLVNVFEQ